MRLDNRMIESRRRVAKRHIDYIGHHRACSRHHSGASAVIERLADCMAENTYRVEGPLTRARALSFAINDGCTRSEILPLLLRSPIAKQLEHIAHLAAVANIAYRDTFYALDINIFHTDLISETDRGKDRKLMCRVGAA